MRRSIGVLLLIGCSSCARLPAAPVPNASTAQSRAVVFDIDGTLTPDVNSIFSVRPDAARAVQAFADRGYKIVYLSARVKLFQGNIPGWLKDNGFPDGTVHVQESEEDEKDHAKFKTRKLREYRARGWAIEYAYGDSTTDFVAYANVGIPKERVFALQRASDTTCQPGVWNECLKGWNGHINSILKLTRDKGDL